MSSSEQRFAEVTGDDLFRLADRSEVYASVPTEQYIDVRRYIFQLGFGERNRKEWLQQFGDAIELHGIADFRLRIADWLGQHLALSTWHLAIMGTCLGGQNPRLAEC